MSSTLSTSIGVSTGAVTGGISLLRMATAAIMPSSDTMLDDIEPISISYPRCVPLNSQPTPEMAAATAALSRPAVSFSASTARSAPASTAATDSASTPSSSLSYSPPKLPRSSLAALAATGPGGTTISNSGGGSSGSSSSGPLRVPLLEEEIRLLHRALAESGKQKDSYKSHILDLEKTVLDLREDKRCAEEQLRAKSDALEEWSRRDRQEQDVTVERERAWTARMEAKETELARAQKKSFELEDALYAERSALAELRASAAQALQTEQRFKAECEAQLKKQVRALCIERNSAVQRASELESDLAQARQLSARVAEEKARLFDQLYSASRLGPDHQPARECRAPEAALLELQRSEMENLRARLERENEESASRTQALRVELRAALQSQHDLRDKVADLKAALKKCMAAMDEQRDEAEGERRALQGKVDELQRQLRQQRDDAPLSSREAMPQQTVQQAQTQIHPHQQSPAQMRPQSQPQPQPTQPQHAHPATSSSVTSPKPAAAAPTSTSTQPFSALSSHEALAQTQLLLQQEQAATELRRQRREERRQALHADDTEPAVAAAVAPVAPVPSVPVAGPTPQSFSLDLSRVNGWSGTGAAPAAGQSATLTASPPSRAPLVISAAQPPPAAAAAPVHAASSVSAPTTALMPPVMFDWSFMDERGPAMRPFAQVRLQPEGEETSARPGAGAAAAAEQMTFEEAKEAQMHRALEHALREVEKDHLKRHSLYTEHNADALYEDRYASAHRPPYSPPRAGARAVSAASVRPHRADHASDEHTLEYALAQLARLKRRSEAHESDTDRDADLDGSETHSGQTSQVSSARSVAAVKSVVSSKSTASSLRRASGAVVPSKPVAKPVVSTAVRSVSVKKSASTSSVGGARTRDSGSNKEAVDHPRGPLYKPSAAVLAAAASAMDEDDQEPTSSHADAAGSSSSSGARMAPLRKHAVSAVSTRVPRLNLPAPLSPAQQHKARSSSRSRGSGRSDSVERGGALGRVTANLRKNAASIKKHQFK